MEIAGDSMMTSSVRQRLAGKALIGFDMRAPRLPDAMVGGKSETRAPRAPLQFCEPTDTSGVALPRAPGEGSTSTGAGRGGALLLLGANAFNFGGNGAFAFGCCGAVSILCNWFA